MSRLRTLTWATGVGVLAVTFAGAAKLVGTPTTAPVPAPPAGLVGTTVHGVVDSDPPPIPVGPPAAAGQYPVDQVFVAEGQMVQADDKLVQFDDRQLRAKLDQAKGKKAGAEALLEKARQGRAMQAARVAAQNQAINAAEDTVKAAQDAQRQGGAKLEAFLRTGRNPVTGQPFSEDEKNRFRGDNPDLAQLDTVITQLRHKLDGERQHLAVIQAAPVEAEIRAAEADLQAAAGLVAEAQAAVDSCLVRAHRTGGMVEQLVAAPGVTFGPASQRPLLLLVPAGKRVVRAEVDPEFAYRVQGKLGASVTVTDFTNTALTYAGVVRRQSDIFLPKRNAGLALDPPKVLECVIDLPDPAPAGKPPLRVNQPVRVIFPQ
jgi:multidrug efflux pump subunit AcrA (membrane-fusion protein)